MSDVDELTTIIDMPEAPDQCSPGDKQRLRINVPNVSTTLSMGAPAPPDSIRDGDAGEPNYAGFGVTTAGNIFMDAEKSATLQARSHIDIHTQDNVYIGGVKKVAVAAQTENVFVQGGGGVTIAGGIAWAGHEQLDPQGEDTVATPNWLNSCANTTDQISTLWSVVDGAAAAINSGIAIARGALSFSQPKSAQAWNWVNVAIDALNIAGNAGLDPFGGTTIHGHSGLILGTFGTMGIYSGAGTGIMSCIGVSMLAPSVGMTGIIDAAVESAGETTVFGRSKLKLGSRGTVTLTSRAKDVQILGTALFLGGPSGEDGATQKKTNKLEANAESVVINTGEMQTTVDKKFAVDAMDVLLGSGDKLNINAGNDLTARSTKVEITADTEASMMVSGGMGICLKKSELFIGVNTAVPSFDRKAAGKGKRGKEKSRAVAQARAEWEDKTQQMTAGDVGAKFKNGKIQFIVKGNRFLMDDGKFKTGSLVWKK